MAEQLSFPGLAAVPKPTDGLFFAIFPEEAAAARIARLARQLRSEHGLRGQPLTTARFHVSLHGLGDFTGLPQAVVAAANDAAAAVAVPVFDVMFDRAMSFRGGPTNRPLVLCGGDGVAALTAFQQAFGAAMMRAGLGGQAQRRFTPHLTLLYGDRSIPEQAVEAISWTVREFVLVHSLLGQGRYVRLSRWPLCG